MIRFDPVTEDLLAPAFAIRDYVARRPVRVAIVGLVALAAVQILTGTAILGHATQEGLTHVLQALLIVGLANRAHDDLEALPHERQR